MGIDLDIEKTIIRTRSTIIFGQVTLVMEIHDRITFLILRTSLLYGLIISLYFPDFISNGSI